MGEPEVRIGRFLTPNWSIRPKEVTISTREVGERQRFGWPGAAWPGGISVEGFGHCGGRVGPGAGKDAKGAAGMDEYQMRGWPGWQRHMAMVCLAMLFILKEKVICGEEAPLFGMAAGRSICRVPELRRNKSRRRWPGGTGEGRPILIHGEEDWIQVWWIYYDTIELNLLPGGEAQKGSKAAQKR